MPSVDEIRTLTIKSIEEGLDETTAKLNKLSQAQAGVAVVSDTSSKASTSVASALQRQQMSLDTSFRSQQQFNKAQLDITRGFNEGLIPLDRYNQLTQLNQQRLDQASQSHSVFQRALTGVQGQLVALAAGAGPVGVFLAGLGPMGVAAAAAIGAVRFGMDALVGTAEQLAGKAQGIRSFAMVTELTTNQIQSLIEKGSDFAVSGDQVTSFIERFTTQLSQARNAQGPYYDKLREINPALAQQVLTTKNVADQVNILAAAYKLAGVNGNELLKTAGGHGGVSAAPLVQAIGDAGGINNLPANPSGMSAEMIKQLADLDAASKTAGEHVRDNLAMMFSGTVLEHQKNSRQEMEAITAWMRDFKVSDAWNSFVASFSRMIGAGGVSAANFQPPAVPVIPVESGNLGAATGGGNPSGLSPQAIANMGKATLGAMGAAATAADQYNQRVKELNVSLKEGILTQDEYNRALGVAGIDAAVARLNLYNAALGTGATVADAVAVKTATLQKQQAQGAGLSETQLANARRLIQAQADGTFALQAQIDSTKVQAQSYDMAAGAAETFRIVQTKVNENLNAGRPALDGLSQQFYGMAKAAGASAQALEKVKIDSSIKFSRDTALLTPEDVQIAQQLKGIYGNDIPAALASSEAAAMRLNGAMASTSQQISGGLTTALTDVAMGTKTAGQAFQDFSLMAIRAIEQMIIQLMIVGPLMRSLGSPSGGGVIGSVAAALGFADGGYTGGGGTSQVAGVVHGQEFVVNAAATSQYRGLLEAINSSPIRGYEDGGYVSMPSAPSIVPARWNGGAGNSQKNVTIEQHFHISGVTGEELSRKTQDAATGALKQAVGYTDASIKHNNTNVLPALIPEITDRNL